MIVERTSTPKELHPINHQNWLDAKDVKATFSVGHDGSDILLQYNVNEPQVRAVNTEINSSVWEDSCVEFFFKPEGDENYYNFEINAIGTVLGGYGKDGKNREKIQSSYLEMIETVPSLGREPFDSIDTPTEWSVKIKIPLKALVFSKIESLYGLKGSANFYKCGDKLRQPHFLSWNKVQSPEPNFHLSQFFGEIRFI